MAKEYVEIDGIPITQIDYNEDENAIYLFSGKEKVAVARNMQINPKSIAKVKKRKARLTKINSVLIKVGSVITAGALVAGLVAGGLYIKKSNKENKLEKEEILANSRNLVASYVQTVDGRAIVMEFLTEALDEVEEDIEKQKAETGLDYSGQEFIQIKLENDILDAQEVNYEASEAAELGQTELAQKYIIDYAGRLKEAVLYSSEYGMIIGEGKYKGYANAIVVEGKIYMEVDIAMLENGILPKGSLLIDNTLYAPANAFEKGKALS